MLSTLDDVKRRHEAKGADPAEAMKLWFEVCFIYMDEDRRELGREALCYLTIPFKDDAEWDIRPSSQTFVWRLRDPSHHHIFHSYSKGATPQNQYRCDPTSFDLSAGGVRQGDAHGLRLLLYRDTAEDDATDVATDVTPESEKIGRASCRERVFVCV